MRVRAATIPARSSRPPKRPGTPSSEGGAPLAPGVSDPEGSPEPRPPAPPADGPTSGPEPPPGTPPKPPSAPPSDASHLRLRRRRRPHLLHRRLPLAPAPPAPPPPPPPPPNQPPSFTAGPDQTVLEDAGSQTVAWATGVSAGPAGESQQSVTFTVSVSNPSLFSTQPAVSAGGTLTYAPAADAFGSCHGHRRGERQRRNGKRRGRFERNRKFRDRRRRGERRTTVHGGGQSDGALVARRAVRLRLGDRHLARPGKRGVAERHLRRDNEQPGAVRGATRRVRGRHAHVQTEAPRARELRPSPYVRSTTAAPRTGARIRVRRSRARSRSI